MFPLACLNFCLKYRQNATSLISHIYHSKRHTLVPMFVLKEKTNAKSLQILRLNLRVLKLPNLPNLSSKFKFGGIRLESNSYLPYG